MFATLLYRSWLEVRSRVVSAAVALALLGVATVLRAPATIAALEAFHGERVSYALYVWLSLPRGWLQFTWIVVALLLAMGGLLREQALGTAGFTLALPVRRSRIVAARALVGAASAAVLAAIPLLLVTVLSPLAGYAFPLREALLFTATTAGVGMVFYGLGFVLSHLFRGEYTAPAVGLGLIGVAWVLTRLPLLHPYDVFRVMNGAPYLDETTLRFARLPLPGVVAGMMVFATMAVASMLLVRRRDF
jgi:ABC-type transport system involved in multi-copper enzyme maturation permease subunit